MITIPGMLIFHAKLVTYDSVRERQRQKVIQAEAEKEEETVFSEIESYILGCIDLPWKSKCWGLLPGIMVSIGYCLNFMASDVIAAAVAFGICACEPVANLIFGIVFGDTLVGADRNMKVLFFGTILLFSGAILLMSMSAA